MVYLFYLILFWKHIEQKLFTFVSSIFQEKSPRAYKLTCRDEFWELNEVQYHYAGGLNKVTDFV